MKNFNKHNMDDIRNKRYVIWNNKGGVGKTALTFVIATEYAISNPEKEVIVIDVCPQANVSEVILGGNGMGSKKAQDLMNHGNTIGGYFRKRIENTPYNKTGNESSYAVKAKLYNDQMPENLSIVVGDPILERLVDSMTGLARQDMPQDAWAKIHSWIGDLIDGIMNDKGGRAVFLLDCNPSFAIYTKQALLATKRLIVPCTADGSSLRGIDNIASLVYGINNEYDVFSKKAKEFNLTLPLIHLVPLNQSTQYNKDAAMAFKSLYGEVRKKVENLKNSQKHIFSEEGLSDTFFDVMDMHSAFKIAIHEGSPLSKLKAGPHTIHGESCQVNAANLEKYQGCVNDLIKRF